MTSTEIPSFSSSAATWRLRLTVLPHAITLTSRARARDPGLAEGHQVVRARLRRLRVDLPVEPLVLEEEHRIVRAAGGLDEPLRVGRVDREDDLPARACARRAPRCSGCGTARRGCSRPRRRARPSGRSTRPGCASAGSGSRCASACSRGTSSPRTGSRRPASSRRSPCPAPHRRCWPRPAASCSTRPGNAVPSPRVTPKTPPFGSATSSPHMTILGLRSISSRRPWLIASTMRHRLVGERLRLPRSSTTGSMSLKMCAMTARRVGSRARVGLLGGRVDLRA